MLYQIVIEIIPLLLRPPLLVSNLIALDKLLEINPKVIVQLDGDLIIWNNTKQDLFDPYDEYVEPMTKYDFEMRLMILVSSHNLVHLARFYFKQKIADQLNIQLNMSSQMMILMCEDYETRDLINPLLIHRMDQPLKLLAGLKSYGLKYIIRNLKPYRTIYGERGWSCGWFQVELNSKSYSNYYQFHIIELEFLEYLLISDLVINRDELLGEIKVNKMPINLDPVHIVRTYAKSQLISIPTSPGMRLDFDFMTKELIGVKYLRLKPDPANITKVIKWIDHEILGYYLKQIIRCKEFYLGYLDVLLKLGYKGDSFFQELLDISCRYSYSNLSNPLIILDNFYFMHMLLDISSKANSLDQVNSFTLDMLESICQMLSKISQSIDNPKVKVYSQLLLDKIKLIR